MPNCESWRFIDIDVTVKVKINSTNMAPNSYGGVTTTRINGDYELKSIRTDPVNLSGGVISCEKPIYYNNLTPPEGFCQFTGLPSGVKVPTNFWDNPGYFALKGMPGVFGCAGLSGLVAYLPYVPKPNAISVNQRATNSSGTVVSEQNSSSDGAIYWEDFYTVGGDVCKFSSLSSLFANNSVTLNDNLLPLFGFIPREVYVISCEPNEEGLYERQLYGTLVDTHLPTNSRFYGLARGVMSWSNVFHTNQINYPVYYNAYVPSVSQSIPIEIRDGAVAIIGEGDEPTAKIEIQITEINDT